jgi:hypothetical protein
MKPLSSMIVGVSLALVGVALMKQYGQRAPHRQPTCPATISLKVEGSTCEVPFEVFLGVVAYTARTACRRASCRDWTWARASTAYRGDSASAVITPRLSRGSRRAGSREYRLRGDGNGPTRRFQTTGGYMAFGIGNGRASDLATPAQPNITLSQSRRLPLLNGAVSMALWRAALRMSSVASMNLT